MTMIKLVSMATHTHKCVIRSHFVHSGNASISSCSMTSGVNAPARGPSLGWLNGCNIS